MVADLLPLPDLDDDDDDDSVSTQSHNPVRVCKYCKYYIPVIVACSHPMATSVSILSGRKTYAECSRMRETNCGLRGYLFEPRISTWAKIIAALRGVWA